MFSGVIEVKLAEDQDFYIAGQTVRSLGHRPILELEAAVRGPSGGTPFALDRAKIRRMFGAPEALRTKRALLERKSGRRLPDLATYLELEVPTRRLRDVRALVERLNQLPGVEAAYPMPILKKPASPNLVPDQDYLRAAPGGVNADATLLQALTRGGGIRIGDVEHGWDLLHEDLPSTCTNVNEVAAPDEIDHGTAVLGEMFGLKNTFGVTGIAPEADCYVADWLGATGTFNVAYAMDRLDQSMTAGDVILIEVQVYGPRTKQNDESCYGCLPAEWVKSVYDKIKLLTAAGIVVVEAAGNGGQDLDDVLYEGYFDRSRLPGAIMVGAGESSASETPHAKLFFSNFGERVDVQGFGEKVTTAGYGTIGSGHTAYTHGFNGTSSASPIVAGSVAVINGYLLASDQPPLSGTEMADLLKSTGTSQAGGGGNIGPLPNLTAALAALGTCGDGLKVGSEVCDDGNTVSGDGCSADCSSQEVCGNGVVDAQRGETCDDGNIVSGDGCRADCKGEETCGDGHLDPREICDDGNAVGGDGCSGDRKRLEICGDRHIDPGERCDDGNTRSGDGCSADCKSEERCGNGIVDTSINEECDDGNFDEMDACTSVCEFYEPPPPPPPPATSGSTSTSTNTTTKPKPQSAEVVEQAPKSQSCNAAGPGLGAYAALGLLLYGLRNRGLRRSRSAAARV